MKNKESTIQIVVGRRIDLENIVVGQRDFSKVHVSKTERIVAYLLCHTLYYLGHFTSKILEWSWMEKYEWWGKFWYPLYSNLMGYSVYWNDVGGFDVWGQPEKQECSCGIPGGCICGHEKQ